MDIKELVALRDSIGENIRKVMEVVKTMTTEKPLILYDKDKLDGTDDKFYELPFAYYVDKHSFYCEGRIVEVHGNDVLMLFTGEEFGDEHHLDLDAIPFESLIDLLDYLIER